MISRRAILGGGATLLARTAVADEEPYQNLRVVDGRADGRRFVLVTPRYIEPEAKLPLVVVLHGLAETIDERAGAFAWLERYGLASAWNRLKSGRISRTSLRGEWTDGRLAEVNADLAQRPFRGFALACPFMPNPTGSADLDAYATWIGSSLLPRVRRDAPVYVDTARTYLAGVSLGAYVALEVLVRLPQVFGAWAGVQTAIGSWAAPRYAQKIASGATPPAMLVLTSSLDTFRASSEALANALEARKIAHAFRTVPGPHDQPWLREAGTIEALLWLDRVAP